MIVQSVCTFPTQFPPMIYTPAAHLIGHSTPKSLEGIERENVHTLQSYTLNNLEFRIKDIYGVTKSKANWMYCVEKT